MFCLRQCCCWMYLSLLRLCCHLTCPSQKCSTIRICYFTPCWLWSDCHPPNPVAFAVYDNREWTLLVMHRTWWEYSFIYSTVPSRERVFALCGIIRQPVLSNRVFYHLVVIMPPLSFQFMCLLLSNVCHVTLGSCCYFSVINKNADRIMHHKNTVDSRANLPLWVYAA